jgi:hypothetical protein
MSDGSCPPESLPKVRRAVNKDLDGLTKTTRYIERALRETSRMRIPEADVGP